MMYILRAELKIGDPIVMIENKEKIIEESLTVLIHFCKVLCK